MCDGKNFKIIALSFSTLTGTYYFRGLTPVFWATVYKTVPRVLSDRFLSVCPVLSVTLVYCGQTVGWIKMKRVTEVGLGSGHIVLDGDPAPPPPKGA